MEAPVPPGGGGGGGGLSARMETLRIQRCPCERPSPPLGAFGLLLDESTPEVVGRILGSGAAAEARWHHLAGDAAACEAIKTSVVLQHIVPLPEWKACSPDPRERTRLANRLGGQFCKPSGSDALLLYETPGWDVCVLLARFLAQRDGEADDEYASRCRLHHAWAATRAFEKAGVILLILRQAAALLGAGANLFEGMPPHSLACLSPGALGAHLRVPSRLRLEGCAVERLIYPGYAASTAPAWAADDSAWAAYQLTEAVRCIVTGDPLTSLDEMCERLDALGLRVDREQVEEERSKAKRVRAERRAAAAEAMDDAVEPFDSNVGAWMRANGVSNPSAKEAARLRVLSDRLCEQRHNGDFDGAVDTWLETKHGSGIRPTRNDRNVATRKVQAFFADGGSPTMQQRGGRGQAAWRRVRRAR